MARIRSTRPEFWEDEDIGDLTRDARLLFVASWNYADDEGLIRWTPTYLKSNAFRYDGDLSPEDVASLMVELERGAYVLPYTVDGKRLGWIVKFRRHQKPNRPQPSRLPPPPLADPSVRDAYGDRDRWMCSLCGERIEPGQVLPVLCLPRLAGGTEHPMNVQIVHPACVHGDVTDDSVNVQGVHSEHSLAEGRGNGGEKEGRGSRARCTRHAHLPDDDPGPACIACRDVRLASEHPRPVPVPDWCGECDENTRQVEQRDGRIARCQTCHPLRSTA